MAATLESVQGQVAVNSGTGFKQARSGAQANEGDQVMTGPDSSTVLVFRDGCRITIEPRRVVTVRESFCRAGYVQRGFIGSLGPLGLGTGAALTGFLISTSDDDDNRRPVSP